ncbi:kxDL motif-containing protein CG10681 [Calliphora vicina]|uniref:kxDL motif-containing protein CG10681 n=1 Tax=Calliphora vicina TaxID=7373 RepID=UPI00325ACF6C
MSNETSFQQSETINNDVTQDVTPESEFSMDGFNSYTAGEAFIQGLAGLVNQSDVETMIRAQKQMLQRFEKTNEMLLNCNALSQSRLKQANDDFKRHCKVLADMKKDLDYIFRKIRSIKQKLSHQYPIAYAEAQPQRSSLAEEAEDETELKRVSGAVCKTKESAKTDDPNVPSCSKKVNEVDKPSSSTTVEYVQMEEAVDNGKPIENELIKRVCSIETTNPNDSSDCTSEDTG